MAALDCKERLVRKRQKLIRSNRAKEQRVEGGAAASMTTVFLSAGFQLSSHQCILSIIHSVESLYAFMGFPPTVQRHARQITGKLNSQMDE